MYCSFYRQRKSHKVQVKQSRLLHNQYHNNKDSLLLRVGLPIKTLQEMVSTQLEMQYTETGQKPD